MCVVDEVGGEQRVGLFDGGREGDPIVERRDNRGRQVVRSEPVLNGTDRNGRRLNMLNYLDTPRNVNRTYDEW